MLEIKKQWRSDYDPCSHTQLKGSIEELSRWENVDKIFQWFTEFNSKYRYLYLMGADLN